MIEIINYNLNYKSGLTRKWNNHCGSSAEEPCNNLIESEARDCCMNNDWEKLQSSVELVQQWSVDLLAHGNQLELQMESFYDCLSGHCIASF